MHIYIPINRERERYEIFKFSKPRTFSQLPNLLWLLPSNYFHLATVLRFKRAPSYNRLPARRGKVKEATMVAKATPSADEKLRAL